MTPTVFDELSRTLGAKVTQRKPLGGGDINDAFAVTLDDDRTVFVKTNRNPPEGMFPAEARGLAWLEEAGALRVPRVLAVSESFLALEFLRSGKRQAGFDEALGRGLASLHAFGAPSFGLGHDNYIGRLYQSNRVSSDWASFYWTERLEPQLRLASDRGRMGSPVLRRFERLRAALPSLVGGSEPPARLHGDLWGGNLHVDDEGAPCLIDPAVYGGHREIDLAMMRLFGGFSARVFESYAEAYPLLPGAEERVSLYQLYPLLVHVNLFGSSYVGSVERALSDCGS
jgi:fructosamine-3-kinase